MPSILSARLAAQIQRPYVHIKHNFTYLIRLPLDFLNQLPLRHLRILWEVQEACKLPSDLVNRSGLFLLQSIGTSHHRIYVGASLRFHLWASTSQLNFPCFRSTIVCRLWMTMRTQTKVHHSVVVGSVLLQVYSELSI